MIQRAHSDTFSLINLSEVWVEKLDLQETHNKEQGIYQRFVTLLDSKQSHVPVAQAELPRFSRSMESDSFHLAHRFV